MVTNPERSAPSAQLSLRQISKFGSMHCDLVFSNFFSELSPGSKNQLAPSMTKFDSSEKREVDNTKV